MCDRRCGSWSYCASNFTRPPTRPLVCRQRNPWWCSRMLRTHCPSVSCYWIAETLVTLNSWLQLRSPSSFPEAPKLLVFSRELTYVSRFLAYYNETILLFLVGLPIQTLWWKTWSHRNRLFFWNGCPERLNYPTYSNSHGLRDHKFYYLNMFLVLLMFYLQYQV